MPAISSAVPKRGSARTARNWSANGPSAGFISDPDNDQAKLIHYTLGTPCFKDYADTAMAARWHALRQRVNDGMDV